MEFVDYSSDIAVLASFLKGYTIELTSIESSDLVSQIDSIFHLLEESVLRDICSEALRYRDLNPNGTYV